MEFTTLMAGFWSLLGFLAFLRTLVPPHFYQLVEDFKIRLLERWSLYREVLIRQDSGAGENELYNYARRYSSTIDSGADAIYAERRTNAKKLSFSIASHQQAFDQYKGRQIKWQYFLERQDGPYRSREEQYFKFTFSKADKAIVPEYLQFVMEKGKEIEKQDDEKKMYTNMRHYWESVPFNPPATFDTVAMEPDMKQLLVEDLTRFMNGKQFYNSVGRAWKRGYLLYGPPGTGKSSLINAIANFTGYDLYDLELTKVKDNMDLRELLLRVKNRAIIVVEDIDCSVPFESRSQKGKNLRTKKKKKMKNMEIIDDQSGVTLSGLLNFTDGLWSSCGSERIFIFTTNYVKKLDPALLRPGRMDMHISMSYCSFTVLKVLVSNYLKIQEHALFPQIEELISQVRVSPASIIEELLRHVYDSDTALNSLVEMLKNKQQGTASTDDHDHDNEDDQDEDENSDETESDEGNPPSVKSDSEIVDTGSTD